jgi:hypothetical protein
MCEEEDTYRILVAKSEVEGTTLRPKRRQEANGLVHEMCHAANTSHNLSVINVVCTNIHLI